MAVGQSLRVWPEAIWDFLVVFSPPRQLSLSWKVCRGCQVQCLGHLAYLQHQNLFATKQPPRLIFSLSPWMLFKRFQTLDSETPGPGHPLLCIYVICAYKIQGFLKLLWFEAFLQELTVISYLWLPFHSQHFQAFSRSPLASHWHQRQDTHPVIEDVWVKPGHTYFLGGTKH